MKLYHATGMTNWKSIKKIGLKPYFPAVYMTSDINTAKFFRDRSDNGVILEIETDGLNQELIGRNDEMLCHILNTEPFYHYYGEIPPEAIVRLRIK